MDDAASWADPAITGNVHSEDAAEAVKRLSDTVIIELYGILQAKIR